MYRKPPHPLQTLAPDLIDLTRAELRAVRPYGTVVAFAPDRVVCTSDQNDQLGLVLTGELLAGNGTAVERLGPGDCFATGSLQTHDGATFAMTPAEVIVYDPRELSSVAEVCPHLYSHLTATCRGHGSRGPAPAAPVAAAVTLRSP